MIAIGERKIVVHQILRNHELPAGDLGDGFVAAAAGISCGVVIPGQIFPLHFHRKCLIVQLLAAEDTDLRFDGLPHGHGALNLHRGNKRPDSDFDCIRIRSVLSFCLDCGLARLLDTDYLCAVIFVSILRTVQRNDILAAGDVPHHRDGIYVLVCDRQRASGLRTAVGHIQVTGAGNDNLGIFGSGCRSGLPF